MDAPTPIAILDVTCVSMNIIADDPPTIPLGGINASFQKTHAGRKTWLDETFTFILPREVQAGLTLGGSYQLVIQRKENS